MRRLFAKRRLGIATRHLAWVALGFFGMLLALAMVLARVGANRLLDAVRWYGTLTASERTIGWDGRITLDKAQFVPHGADESGGLKAERVTIETGGPIWLMRLALRRTSAERLERRRKELEASGALEKDNAPPVLPAAGRLVLKAEGVTIGPAATLARWVPWLDPSNGVLFAALGCREAAGLSHAVAQRAGDPGRFDVRLQLKQRRETAVVAATFVFGGISTATWQGSFLPASNLGLLAGDWRQWQMLEQQWTLRDREFVRARNRECARRLALPRPQFVARHALAVKRQLAAWKIALPAPLEHAYREHASVGGEIVFVSRPKQPLRLGEYQLMSRSQRVGALDGQVIMAGRRLPLLLEFLPDAIGPTAVAAASVDDAGSEPPAAIASGATASTPQTGSSIGDSAVASTTQSASSIAATQSSPGKGTVPPNAASAIPPDRVGAGMATPGVTAQTAVVAKPGSAAVLAGALPADSKSAAGSTLAAKPPLPGVSSSSTAAPSAAVPATASASLPSQGNYGGLLGRRVTITTTYGTARTGKIRIANKVAVTLEMQTNDGPIQLRIPSEQIVRVRTAPL